MLISLPGLTELVIQCHRTLSQSLHLLLIAALECGSLYTSLGGAVSCVFLTSDTLSSQPPRIAILCVLSSSFVLICSPHLSHLKCIVSWVSFTCWVGLYLLPNLSPHTSHSTEFSMTFFSQFGHYIQTWSSTMVFYLCFIYKFLH